MSLFFALPTHDPGTQDTQICPSARPYPTGRPDLSNLVKLVEDALNENAFKDDSRIVCTEAAKIYGDRARTEIVLRAAE